MGATTYSTSGRLDRKAITQAKKVIAEKTTWLDSGGTKRLYAARNSDPVAEAMSIRFSAVVDDCRYEYGHGGYTGTFAEKSDIETYVLKADLTTRQWTRLITLVEDGLRKWDDKAGGYGDMVPREPLGPEVTVMKKLRITVADVHIMHEVYDDKWGPALGLITPDRRYWMGGWCSE